MHQFKIQDFPDFPIGLDLCKNYPLLHVPLAATF